MALTLERLETETALGTLERRQFYAARLREQGCEVEWQGSADNAVVSRVVIPHPELTDETKDQIFHLVVSLFTANFEGQRDPQGLNPVPC